MEHHIFSLSVIFTFLLQNDAAKWTYDGDLGPRHWHKLFPDGCSGKQQSPIDITTQSSEHDPKLGDFAIWHDPPKPGSLFKVKNNGHSITIETLGPFHVTNGGLPSVYSTAQFHFHWGHADHQGSEHLIDNRASPLELHVVNYDSENYQSLPMAMVQPQGLAVLGVMYEIGVEDNPALEPIIQAMKHVEDPEDDHHHELPAQRIRNFLPEDTSKYYRYNGSLTTPGCFESVIWTVFHDPMYISVRQMMAFRKILQNKRHKGKKHHKRETKDEKLVEEVLEESGMAGDKLQQMELEMTLEEDKAKDNLPTETPTLGEPPKKFYLHHGENPNTDKMQNVSQSGKEQSYITESEKHLEQIVVKLEHENEQLIEEIERLKLVDNFRPVQPLNGRKIYRSFDSFVKNPASQEIKDSTEPCNSSIKILSSWTVLLVTIFVSFFR
ncbi:carbonic anhydrase 14-like [Mytilus trossulus]|uniref:carbonic anhydrase 14-like n=1 Tax=Mytilus trossulus TaxID=6551 RepID=UPI003007A290